MAIHNDEANLAAQVASTITRAGGLSFLTDATVAAADTKLGLKNAINAVAVHNDSANIKALLIRALDLNANITDANIAGLTTVAGLANLVGAPFTTTGMILD